MADSASASRAATAADNAAGSTAFVTGTVGAITTVTRSRRSNSHLTLSRQELTRNRISTRNNHTLFVNKENYIHSNCAVACKDTALTTVPAASKKLRVRKQLHLLSESIEEGTTTNIKPTTNRSSPVITRTSTKDKFSLCIDNPCHRIQVANLYQETSNRDASRNLRIFTAPGSHAISSKRAKLNRLPVDYSTPVSRTTRSKIRDHRQEDRKECVLERRKHKQEPEGFRATTRSTSRKRPHWTRYVKPTTSNTNCSEKNSAVGDINPHVVLKKRASNKSISRCKASNYKLSQIKANTRDQLPTTVGTEVYNKQKKEVVTIKREKAVIKDNPSVSTIVLRGGSVNKKRSYSPNKNGSKNPEHILLHKQRSLKNFKITALNNFSPLFERTDKPLTIYSSDFSDNEHSSSLIPSVNYLESSIERRPPHKRVASEILPLLRVQPTFSRVRGIIDPRQRINQPFSSLLSNYHRLNCSQPRSSLINEPDTHHLQQQRHEYPLRSKGRLTEQICLRNVDWKHSFSSSYSSDISLPTDTRKFAFDSIVGTALPPSQYSIRKNITRRAIIIEGGNNTSYSGLTRSGAVLRRSTRYRKEQATTTGSCASSSGSRGAAASGSSQQHKVDADTTSTVTSVTAKESIGADPKFLYKKKSVDISTVTIGSFTSTLRMADHNHAYRQKQFSNVHGSGNIRQDCDESVILQRDISFNTSTAIASDSLSNCVDSTTTSIAGSTIAGGLLSSGGGGVDSESDDGEVGRLQALLEARGLPPHLFGALGPRMQHLLHRSMGVNSSSSKAQHLLTSLQATGDEGQQLQAVIEMCQMLVMGNEDTLTGFPVKQVVPALMTLLRLEHNFDIMNHACRALTYMMEALPRACAVIVDAVPIFLEKLQIIQCMDVAEQSLTALDMLSRRHSKSILLARGVSACLTYLDFFSINAQRAALSVTANCCLNLSAEEFEHIAESLPLLTGRLLPHHHDKKSVECVCLAFSRLVDSFQLEPPRLQEIAGAGADHELLNNLQRLLILTPPLISTGTFITVLRMLCVMSANCRDLAIFLLRHNIADTLLYLLTGRRDSNLHVPKDDKYNNAIDNNSANDSGNGTEEVDLLARQPQELYEITSLIAELMPKLPTDGIFAVDSLLERSTTLGICSGAGKDQPQWQWCDDTGLWHFYGAVDSRMIEVAHISGDDEVSLNTLGRTYTIDYHSMSQINEDTGTTRSVRRRYTTTNTLSFLSDSVSGECNSRRSSSARDARVASLREERGLSAVFVRTLFNVLYEVYSSSAGPTVRCKCLKALLRMVYYASPNLLREVLRNQVLSSHIAGMIASSDLRIVVGALQLADMLMSKLPEVFGVHFRREGVMYQIHKLADPSVPLGYNTSQFSNTGDALYTSTPECIPKIIHIDGPTPTISSNAQCPTMANKSCENIKTRSRYTGNISKTSNFLQSLNPAKWGRSLHSSSAAIASSSDDYQHHRSFGKENSNFLVKSSSNSNLTAGNREKTRTWIKEQALRFIDVWQTSLVSNELPHPDLNVLSCLTSAIKRLSPAGCSDALSELRDLLIDSNISAFEVIHSGLIRALLEYLANVNGPIAREQRLRIFLHTFAALPLDANCSGEILRHSALDTSNFAALVNKLSGCVSQLQQFPIRVHDLPVTVAAGRSGGTSALKFFNTHQLKCNLQRHPGCTNLKQWKGGTVKIDPLALVQAIERYLVVRGYSRLRSDKVANGTASQSSAASCASVPADSDGGDSEDDLDETLAGIAISQSGKKHKMQFLIGDQVLPYNITVYQAVRQYSGSDQSETDTDNETPLGHTGVWIQTHTIYYRPLKEDKTVGNKMYVANISSQSSRKGKGSSYKTASKRKPDELWNEGVTPPIESPLTSYLTMNLPEYVTVTDCSLEVLCLLRILNALNRHWLVLYPPMEVHAPTPLLPASEFYNNKIAAKASRQLQDPLAIMTGNLPNWLYQIACSCPFLFPFETRQLLFYATSFDRDRALQRLLDMTPEFSSSDSQERITPRLDRRKRTISRNGILKQAEQVMQDLATSKALLEVHYENEVGTGLGPTLEFYALVSRELQKADLNLWHNQCGVGYGPNNTTAEFVHSAAGLFPLPLARNAKVGQLTRVKTKFKFLGKFMAKAVMDSRMLDLPFSITFYRWLLGEQRCLNISDISDVSPDIYRTLRKMQQVVKDRDEILHDPNLLITEKNIAVEKLHFDDCSFSDLGVDFVLPGPQPIELLRNGRTTPVTIHNLHQYVALVRHWLLAEGVSRQMDSLREGFESVFPLAQLKLFTAEELDAVFCGSPMGAENIMKPNSGILQSITSPTTWDIRTLADCCRPDHGYTCDSRAIRFLFEVLSSYDREQQRQFVQFLTGSPRLPVGGFKSLSPPLTVVRRTLDVNMNPDDFLPSVMTCVNYLKLPDYSSVDIMREKLRLAASEGQHSFYLS